MDLSGSLCLKATSGQSDQRAARGRGYRKAWSRGKRGARAQCQHWAGGRAWLPCLSGLCGCFLKLESTWKNPGLGGGADGPAGAGELE